MTHRYLFPLYVILIAPVGCLFAQPSAQSLWNQWRSGQRQETQRFQQMAANESARCIIENRFEKWDLVTEAKISRQTGSFEPNRRFVNATLNGRAVSDLGNLDFGGQAEWRPRFRRICQASVVLNPGLLLNLEAKSNAKLENFDGNSAYRIKLEVKNTNLPIRAAEVWISRRDGRLLAARLVRPLPFPRLDEPGGPSPPDPLIVNLYFDRLQGIDLIKRSEVTVTFKRKMRGQVFHTVIQLNAQYNGFAFFEK
ncbi:MAG: hypothetical protein JNN12_01790 [Bacteroidetes Order II. Incertae sedis bacterium]|nr:hypothetical protein [Bacteroidetes Order II. bacterium]